MQPSAAQRAREGKHSYSFKIL